MKKSKMTFSEFSWFMLTLYMIYLIITLSSCVSVNVYVGADAREQQEIKTKKKANKRDLDVVQVPGNKNYKIK